MFLKQIRQIRPREARWGLYGGLGGLHRHGPRPLGVEAWCRDIHMIWWPPTHPQGGPPATPHIAHIRQLQCILALVGYERCSMSLMRTLAC